MDSGFVIAQVSSFRVQPLDRRSHVAPWFEICETQFVQPVNPVRDFLWARFVLMQQHHLHFADLLLQRPDKAESSAISRNPGIPNKNDFLHFEGIESPQDGILVFVGAHRSKYLHGTRQVDWYSTPGAREVHKG